MFRSWNFPFGFSPRKDDSREERGGGGAMAAIVIALLVIVLSWGASVLIRFAISRTREFLADAGSVELTKNPDAMISALRKIEAQSAMEQIPSRMQAFFIESPALLPKSRASSPRILRQSARRGLDHIRRRSRPPAHAVRVERLPATRRSIFRCAPRKRPLGLSERGE